MGKTIIRNATLVNEGKTYPSDVLVEDGLISRIGTGLEVPGAGEEIAADGLHLLPGLIDDQVHFREPGLTHKATISTESRAAVAGGITSFMEMPNTSPPTLTQSLLEDKYQLAARDSLANYSFYMGVSAGNMEEILRTDPARVCGVKVFMGSSTGDMLVENEEVLDRLFADAPTLIAAHCEDEGTIRANLAKYRKEYGDDIPVKMHPLIRSAEACYLSSSRAVALARKHGARLHVLHISTARELPLFDHTTPLEQKRITAEACIHHLWFTDADYERLGPAIKWNPAVKTREDRDAVLAGVLDNHIDVLATDHAPHTWDEKNQAYVNAPSGGPLVQHHLAALLELHHRGKISLERLVEKACHCPAICYQVDNRGFIREGYAADLVLVDLDRPWTVDRPSILAKCGWSPFEGVTFRSRVIRTFVNGNKVFENGAILDSSRGQRLAFNR